MKMVKSLLLGSAAGLVAMAGAQAADLPVKAKPVQYVKICSLYGVGFYYVPGTDMCIKVGGWARFETGYGYNGSLTSEWWVYDANNRTTHDNPWRVKGVLSVDARSPTEYGTVRSYITLGESNSEVGDNPTTGNYFNRWFIQWAGFTIGHATSFFDFYSIGANQYGYVGASSDTGDGGWTVFGYTAQFGNGLSATISAEEQRRTQIINVGLTAASAVTGSIGTIPITTAVSTGYRGHDYPDVVANLRVDQAWGSAQIMGALHNVSAQYWGTTEGTGHPNDKLGFALGAGIRINAPMIGPGDYFQAEVDYTEGASRYANATAAVWNYVIFTGNTIGFGINTDAVFTGTTASNLELTTAWAVNAAYTHNWNAAWKSTLWGSYFAESYNSNGNNILCNNNPAVAVPGCNHDWAIWGAGLRTQWAVSSTFQIGLEVLYARLDSASNGIPNVAFVTNTVASAKPTALYTVADQEQWAVRFRVNRDFYP